VTGSEKPRGIAKRNSGKTDQSCQPGGERENELTVHGKGEGDSTMIVEFDTALGFMTLATLDGKVMGLSFGHPSRRAARQSLERFHARLDKPLIGQAAQDDSRESELASDRVVELLICFAAGEPVDFVDVAILTTDMTEFQREVVAACRAIRWGETFSYGELAAQVGHRGAARAVGTVMRKNRLPLIVPCHRVLASGGKLGGYSGSQGLSTKKQLLEMEKSTCSYPDFQLQS
jgi:methylated-DNA-[protein]-cysteine S-methyltransferase